MVEDEEKNTETTHTIRSTRIDTPSDTAIDEEMDTYHEKKVAFRSYYSIWLLVGFINVLLGFRFLFELTAANTSSPFVRMIYAFSNPFAAPFQSIFGMTNISYATFDWSLLVAIVVYLLIGYGLAQIVKIAKPVTTQEMHHHHRVGHV